MDLWKFASRKFILAGMFGAMGSWGLYADKLTGGEFVQLAVGVLGAFSIADAAINFAHRGQGGNQG
jgi:hypothetical protein